MEINQVDQVNSTALNATRPEEVKNVPKENESAGQTATTSSKEAYQVELSEEAQRKQAEERQQVESEQQAARQNNTYNAAGEIAG